ncbi:MAG: DUF2974 domain-containing protein [Clostridiales bacterium]|jgi:hypothetical protein|nr:DUF2974 domain-containing protein [Clostridiales bacterium]
MLTVSHFLILNSLIYIEQFESKKYTNKLIGKSVYDFAINYEYSSKYPYFPAEINEEEFYSLIESIKVEKNIFENVYFLNIENSLTGNKNCTENLVNMTLKYKNNLVFVFKGTSGTYEWVDNVRGTYVADTKRQVKALQYFDKMYKLYADSVDKIYITGHSKGGNKAQYIGVLRGQDPKIKHIYSFDGQGFSDLFFDKYKDLIQKNKKKITSISNENDFVNILMKLAVGNKIYIKSKTTKGKDKDKIAQMTHLFGGWHSPYSMLILKDNKLHINEETNQSEVMKTVGDLFRYYSKKMSFEDNRYFCYKLARSRMSVEYDNDEYFNKEPKDFFKRFIQINKDYEKETKDFKWFKFFIKTRPVIKEMIKIIASKTDE